MECESYREWIEGAAAETPGAAGPAALQNRRDSQALQAHIAVCPRCRAAFEREQRLVAAIDRSLRGSLAAEPSPSFAAGVRARIAEERLRPRSWVAGWAPVAAGALAVILAVAVWVGRRQKAEGGRQQGASVVLPERQMSEVRSQKSEVRSQKGGRRHGALASSERRAASGPDLEVLVPKGQADEVMQLYNSIWDAPPQESSLRAAAELMRLEDEQAKTPEPLEIKPLETPALDAELKPQAAPDDAPDASDK